MNASSHDNNHADRPGSGGTPPASSRRAERLKSALKANIARRKAQARARASAGKEASGNESEASHE